MTKPREIQIQRAIEEWLCEIGLYPFQVLYTTLGPVLKITFLMKPEVTEFLEFFDYQNLADKSGIQIWPDSMTILLSGITLNYFFEKVLSG
jgi:hypothetical protein